MHHLSLLDPRIFTSFGASYGHEPMHHSSLTKVPSSCTLASPEVARLEPMQLQIRVSHTYKP
eukprot:1146481-Pelagomonas_calceolata.AAC.3